MRQADLKAISKENWDQYTKSKPNIHSVGAIESSAHNSAPVLL